MGDNVRSMSSLIADLLPRLLERCRKMKLRLLMYEYIFEHIMGLKLHVTGSRAEGPHTITADADFMFVSSDLRAVTSDYCGNTEEGTHSEMIDLVIDTHGTHPGYSKLKVASTNQLETPVELTKWQNVKLRSLCVQESNGFFMVTSKVKQFWHALVYTLIPKLGMVRNEELHGPCVQLTFNHVGYTFWIDYLYCVPCKQWPEQAKEWISRERNSGWPGKEFVNTLVKEGTFLVPTGYRESLEVEKEWRFSFSFLERKLVWSMNGTQTLCFDLLKSLSKSMKARFPEMIDSYVWKISLLWMCERIEEEHWKPDLAIDRCIDCIGWVINRIEERKCPHYFVPERNMFDGKLANEQLECALAFLRQLCERDHPFWQETLKERLLDYRDDILFKHHITLNGVAFARHLLFFKASSDEPKIVLSQLQLFRKKISEFVTDNPVQNDMKSLLLTCLSTHEGYLHYTLNFGSHNTGNDIVEHAKALMMAGCKSDTASGYMMVATYYFNRGQLKTSMDLLQKTLKQHESQVAYYTSYVWVNKKDANLPNGEMPVLEFCQKYVAFDVFFLPAELKTAPFAIKILLSSGTPVYINPLVYGLYLKFLIDYERLTFQDCEDGLLKMEEDLPKFETENVSLVPTELYCHCCILIGQYGRGVYALSKAYAGKRTSSVNGWFCSIMLWQIVQKH